jgi:predicted ATPase
MQATGITRSEPMALAYLAEGLALEGSSVAEGLRVVAAAFAAAASSGTRWADAELHRLRGDLLIRLPSKDQTEIETCFRTALSVAREQGTRGFELRAAVSLARLLGGQRRREEARDLLASVYAWFTEGFGTPDLQAARALLDELA